MKKYWYYGVRMQQAVVCATGSVRNTQVVRWHQRVFTSAQEAASAASLKMASHPGVSYFIQGFDRELDIDSSGESKGFKAAQ